MSNALFNALKQNKIFLNNVIKINILRQENFFSIDIKYKNEFINNKYVKNNYGRYDVYKCLDYKIDTINYTLPISDKNTKSEFNTLYEDIIILKKINRNISIDTHTNEILVDVFQNMNGFVMVS